MLHLVLHDVLEAFGLYLQLTFLKQVARGWREFKRESGTRGTKASFPLYQTGT